MGWVGSKRKTRREADDPALGPSFAIGALGPAICQIFCAYSKEKSSLLQYFQDPNYLQVWRIGITELNLDRDT